MPGFGGVEDHERPEYRHLHGLRYAANSGSLRWFRNRNDASRLALQPREEDPAQVEDLVAASNYLAGTLDDVYLDRILAELPDDAFTRVPAAQRKPEIRRTFRLVTEGGARGLLDARGRRLSREEAGGLGRWVKALDLVVAPRPGDRVLFERDVLADAPGRRAFRVGIRNGGAYRYTATLGFPSEALRLAE